MSYGTKYIAEFKDYFGKEVEILFKFKEYSGSQIPVKAIEDSGTIYQPENEDNIFHPMRGSEFRIDLLSMTDFQLTDLFVVGKHDVMVDVMVSGLLFWRGWLVPNQYSEPYIPAPYPVTVTARDGIGELKTYVWDYDGFMSPANIIRTVLSKLELGLYLWEAVNLYETSYMNVDVADSMLNQCFFDCNCYVGDSYYDVLSDMLTGLGCEIQQVKGAWKIVRIKEVRGEILKRLQGIEIGQSDTGVENEQIIKLIGRPQNRDFANLDAEIVASPGWNKMYIDQIAGRKYGPINHDFSGKYYDIPGGQMAVGWSRISDSQFERFWHNKKTFLKGKSFNLLPSYENYGLFQIVRKSEETQPYYNSPYRFKVRCSVSVCKAQQFTENVLAGMKTYITVDDGNSIKYLDPVSRIWTNEKTYIEFKNIECTTEDKISFVDYEIYIDEMPLNGLINFYIFAPYPNSMSDMSKLSSWYINEASIDMVNKLYGEYLENGRMSDVQYFGDIINSNMSFVMEQNISMKFCDYPAILNTQLIYRNGIIKSMNPRSGLDVFFTRTSQWQGREGGETVGLYTHLLLNYIWMYGQNRWIIRGTILSNDLNFDNCICDYRVSPKIYYCKSGTYNLRTSMFQGTFHEVGNWTGAPWILEDGTWNDEGIWVDSAPWNDFDPE